MRIHEVTSSESLPLPPAWLLAPPEDQPPGEAGEQSPQSFGTWDDLHREARSRIFKHPSCTLKGEWAHAKGICHDGKGNSALAVHLPSGAYKCKNGCDNAKILAALGLPEKPDGVEQQVQPAPPKVELLETMPAIVDKPLRLIDGHAYAGTWLHRRITITEELDEDGRIVKHDPPITRTQLRSFIVRDDGAVFGGGLLPIDTLGLEVRLKEMPPTDRLWSATGVKAFADGHRSDPLEVFERIVDVVSKFIDFDSSLADQRTMAELIASYILATWFLDAFNVIGFLWSSGHRGSGKTQLLVVIAELSYLGMVILAGGSYASLRDMADYGATLCFDDAENIANVKQTDPDKRALLLAGNRRGSTVTVKEPGPNRTWVTRHIRTFCPRTFSAIALPDAVLASRAIITPLIRTTDRDKANADPMDYAAWPHDRQKLLDDLWATGLAHLAELPAFEAAVNEKANLLGRNLEPWRGLLATALWLDSRDAGGKLKRVERVKDESGVETEAALGLYERLDRLSVRYQTERQEMESGDLTSLVIRALCHCAVSAESAVKEGETKKEWILTTEQVRQAVVVVARDSESDINTERVTGRSVGRILGKMRLRQEPRPGGKGSRKWRVTMADLERWTHSYHLDLQALLTVDSAADAGGFQDQKSALTRPTIEWGDSGLVWKMPPNTIMDRIKARDGASAKAGTGVKPARKKADKNRKPGKKGPAKSRKPS
jgi:hypothetical protein